MSTANDPTAPFTGPAPDATRVGPCRLIRGSGLGGLCTAYLGVHADDALQERVAVKVLEPPVLGRPAEARTALEGGRRQRAGFRTAAPATP